MLFKITFFTSLNDAVPNTFFVDVAHTFGGNLQHYPFIQLGNEELFGVQIGIEFAFCLNVRVWYIVSGDGFLSCNLANSWHLSIFWIVIILVFNLGCKITTLFLIYNTLMLIFFRIIFSNKKNWFLGILILQISHLSNLLSFFLSWWGCVPKCYTRSIFIDSSFKKFNDTLDY